MSKHVITGTGNSVANYTEEKVPCHQCGGTGERHDQECGECEGRGYKKIRY